MATTEGSLLATVRELGVRRQDLLAELDEVEKKLTEAAVALADVGVPEVRVAREAGVSRQTLRVWRGKSDRTGRSKMG